MKWKVARRNRRFLRECELLHMQLKHGARMIQQPDRGKKSELVSGGDL